MNFKSDFMVSVILNPIAVIVRIPGHVADAIGKGWSRSLAGDGAGPFKNSVWSVQYA